MNNSKKRFESFTLFNDPFLNWWGFAIVCRILSSYTHSHWFHPDEWRQTLEPANLIAHGFGYHCQEFGLHLRNLTWPVLLAGVLKITQAIAPNSIDVRIFGVNLICGILDLFILWGWIQVLLHHPISAKLSDKLKNWSLALLLLPWFTLYPAVSPRGEHLSEIAFWIALGCIANRFWVLTGLACVAIFAFRYPSALLSAGIFLALLLQGFRNKDYSFLSKFLRGTLIGLILFGLADWAIYGRPWESFWMYLQYNVLTGSSTRVFGYQDISAYTELFTWNWMTYKLIIPFSIFLLICSLHGFWNDIKKAEPWALCLALYILGHCLVPHKEGRFMIPIETLTRWSAFLGAVLIFQKISLTQSHKKFATVFISLIIFLNGIIFLHALRADLWKERGTYRELSTHLKTVPRVCGIVTGLEISSVLIPFGNSQDFPAPALGSFRTDPPDHLSYLDTKNSILAWAEHVPHCTEGDEILLHAQKVESEWAQEGCTLIDSGILRILPKASWKWGMWALSRNLVKGPWYRCHPSILNHFRSQLVRQIFSKSFGKFTTLPKLGTTAEALENLGLQTSPPPRDSQLPSLSHPSF